MRLRFVRAVLVLALLGNIIVWHRIWRLFAAQNTLRLLTPSVTTSESPQKFHRHLARLVTIVIRQFESFENDVTAVVESVLNSFPAIPILIVCNELPYPPLDLDFANESMRNVRLISVRPEFNKSFEERNPLYYIRTKFVMFLPDATRLSTKQVIQVSHLHGVKKNLSIRHLLNNAVLLAGDYLAGAKIRNSHCASRKDHFALSGVGSKGERMDLENEADLRNRM